MHINNPMVFNRELKLDAYESSVFLFGPRMTGKSFLLKKMNADMYLNLLIPKKELEFRVHPELFWETLEALSPNSLVIVDEIQRVPALLDYVQMGIEEKNIRFILSGSSARKLKRGGGNLLGGRALDLRLHPLTITELGTHFSIESALTLGTIPKIVALKLGGKEKEARLMLRSYVTTYLREEIQIEALVRNLDSFQRFLEVAAQNNAQMIEYANISRECSVAQETVKDYFQILEDTLIAHLLWPYNRSERKKARPKFYFFDTGVVRAFQGRLAVKPSPEELGHLFETWFINELIHIRDYTNKEHRISLWRDEHYEVDVLIEQAKIPKVAFECKTGKNLRNEPSFDRFKKYFPDVPLIVASLADTHVRRLESGVEIWPFGLALQRYRAGQWDSK